MSEQDRKGSLNIAGRRHFHVRAGDVWLARASVVAVVALQLLIINQRFLIGPRWLVPTIEALLLIPLSFVTAWTQRSARDAETDQHWSEVEQRHRWVRRLALVLTAVVSLTNFGSLIALIGELTSGKIEIGGQSLLVDAINIWGTNVIAFGLWFWSIDRGGPASRGLTAIEKCDFLFPQMTMDGATRPAGWSPGFIDYLYLSFTNATAFSPTDTMPLSRRAKLLMMLESTVSLLTIALVAARAVNILA